MTTVKMGHNDENLKTLRGSKLCACLGPPLHRLVPHQEGDGHAVPAV